MNLAMSRGCASTNQTFFAGELAGYGVSHESCATLLNIVAMVNCPRKIWRSIGTAKQVLGSLFQICANVRAFLETYSSCHTGKIPFILNITYKLVELAHGRKFQNKLLL